MKKILKKIISKISDGFLHSIGGAIAVIIGSYLGTYFGNKKVQRTMVEELSRLDSTLIINNLHKKDTVFVVNKEKIVSKAKEFEIAGFQALVEKDIDEAISCFITSENSYNSYHASYEIANYLRKNKQFVSEPDFWEKTYKYVIKHFSSYIPLDCRKAMIE